MKNGGLKRTTCCPKSSRTGAARRGSSAGHLCRPKDGCLCELLVLKLLLLGRIDMVMVTVFNRNHAFNIANRD